MCKAETSLCSKQRQMKMVGKEKEILNIVDNLSICYHRRYLLLNHMMIDPGPATADILKKNQVVEEKTEDSAASFCKHKS